jgi:ATP-dependent DNA helicase RecG
MLDPNDIVRLLKDTETDLVERKESLSDKNRVFQAICAYANDLPGHAEPGYIIVGARDDGSPAGLEITDPLLLTLAGMRDSGKVLPIPHMDVHSVAIGANRVAVIRVFPSDSPPVRLDGQVWIRVGPRRALASAEEERRLTEKNVAGSRTFDRRPCREATLDDLLLETFRNEYLPSVVSREVIAENGRELKAQLASLRLYDLRNDCPTNAGVLLVGRDPLEYFPGAYVQFVRFEGTSLADPVLDQKPLGGNLMTQLRLLEELLPIQVRVGRAAAGMLIHEDVPDYPGIAIRELVLNAIMHRNYDATSAPTRIYWFSDRVEIQNPGGLYGQVTRENYRRISDYRNPVLAEAMKSLGFVDRFGVGIARATSALEKNGNRPPQFEFEDEFVAVTVEARQ